MEEDPKDVIILGAIRRGAKKFDKIQKTTKIKAEEVNEILKKLEERGMIQVEEKKGLFGKKIEITITPKGEREVDERIHEMEEKWNQMSLLYKSGDKQKLQQYMDDNRSFLPMMMFFGIMDIMMFSMMFSMIGASMSNYVPPESMPADAGDAGMSDAGSSGETGDGGFDIDIGF